MPARRPCSPLVAVEPTGSCVAVDLIADNTDVVARRGPAQRDRRLVRAPDDELTWESKAPWSRGTATSPSAHSQPVERLPAASRACTPSVCIVPHARPLTAYCVVAVEPARLPSLRISYPMTPKSSLAAPHPSVTLEDVTATCQTELGWVGGCVSGHAVVAATTRRPRRDDCRPRHRPSHRADSSCRRRATRRCSCGCAAMVTDTLVVAEEPVAQRRRRGPLTHAQEIVTVDCVVDTTRRRARLRRRRPVGRTAARVRRRASLGNA